MRLPARAHCKATTQTTMKIQMLSTQKGSIDGIHIATYAADSIHDLSASKGERELAAAFIGAGMAAEVIEGTIESRPDDAAPGVQVDAQGLEPVAKKAIEAAPENKMMKRAYNRKAKV